jgi:hypothetical protein
VGTDRRVTEVELPAHRRASHRRERLDTGDDVDGLAPRVQASEGGVDLRVGRAIEVLDVQDLDDIGDGLGREHHGSQYRFLGLEVLRRDATVVQGYGSEFVSRASHGRAPLPLSTPDPSTPGRYDA